MFDELTGWYGDTRPPNIFDGRNFPTFTNSFTFGPAGAALDDDRHLAVNIILVSNDLVAFHTDENALIRASKNSFRGLLPLPEERPQRVLFLPEIPSDELEIMLHGVLNVPIDTTQSAIDIRTLIRAMDRLPKYGISPNSCITPAESHLHRFLLSCAPFHPLDVYALAAQYDIISLAVSASSHTLFHELSQITEDLSKRIGSVYMLRLFQLHMGRVDTLKKLLSVELGLHNPTPGCDFRKQRELQQMWNLALASMLHIIKPDTTTTSIRDAVMTHTAELTCKECIELRDKRLVKVIHEWSMAPRTIDM
ncbi:hypothetical protein PM082_005701 [Marasmius tenuissimus]|nr:hypothetical protein PM082_005701 [Marasmius tenuissimus]